MKLRHFLCIAAVFAIFAMSVYFTCTASEIFWRSFENREKIIDMDVSTYQVKYDNVWEKIKIYAVSDKESKFEKINIKLTDENKRELINSVGSQIRTINSYLNNIVPDISIGKIKSCTQYVNYGESDANGFSCWYLMYDGDGKEVRMIVDTEFTAIYRISVSEKRNGGSRSNSSGVLYGKDTKIYEADKLGRQMEIEYAFDWSDCNIHSNLFLAFYKMTMNKVPDFYVNTDSKGIVIYAVYHDDIAGVEVEVPFVVKNILSGDKLVFDWGMSCFDEMIQQ